MTGAERDEMQGELAVWIETTCPLRQRKQAQREFSESELNAVDIVFGDSIRGSLIQARGDYEALKDARIASALWQTNLDVGYINEPEDSNYRKIASLRLALRHLDASDEELLGWFDGYNGWKDLQRTIDQGEPIRIWYSENPRELSGFYYLCTLLKDYSGDVYAVRIPERIRYKDEEKYHLVYGSGQLDSDNAGRIVESAVKLFPMEIRMYAEEWERLKQENAPLRTVIAGKIISVGAGFYDPIIWTYVPDEPVTEEELFRKAYSAMPYIQQGWLTFRIQAMIDKGLIEVVKDNEDPAKRLILRKKD